MEVLQNQKGKIEQVLNEGAFGDIAYLCTSADDVKELYNGFYGHTEIELSRENLNRILNGEILFSTIQYEYSVSIKLKPD
jgi:hypothetical protein